MRVTEAGRFDMLHRELRRTNDGMAAVTERLATGRAITRLSDAPELAVQADAMLSESKAIDAYSSAADNARAWLATQDNALQGGLTALRRARELVISAGVPQTEQSRASIADELDAIGEQLVDLANTSFNGRSVFGGFGDEAVATSGGTATFAGDDGAVQRRVSSDRVVQINVSGADVFGFDAGDDIFNMITDMAAHVRADDTAALTGTDLDRLVTASDRMAEALGTIGARTNQVDSAQALGLARSDDLRNYRSSIVDADLAETALELTMAETAYESVLAATSRLQRPTLVDYLR